MIKFGSPEFLYMAEAEGEADLVSTRAAKLNGVIKTLKQYRVIRNKETIYQVLRSYEIYELTVKEWDYICDSINFH